MNGEPPDYEPFGVDLALWREYVEQVPVGTTGHDVYEPWMSTEAEWRPLPPTKRQLSFLRKNKFTDDKIPKTRGECSDLIDSIISKQPKPEPTEERPSLRRQLSVRDLPRRRSP